MSVDTVNQALTAVRRRIETHPESYSSEGLAKLLTFADILCYQLRFEDVAGFDFYINQKLASDPDAMDFLLGELYSELGFPEGSREDLDAALAAP